MLLELTISNLAVIEHQSISFDQGFNVLSGETGAGKSIILSAVEFILGEKLSTTMIRTGADSLEVQALFDLSTLSQDDRADLPDMIESDELLVIRTLPREGRGKVFMNGRLATQSLLEEVLPKLVSICGQNQHTRLLSPRFHLELLDGFAENSELLQAARLGHREWKAARDALELAAQNRDKVSQRAELLLEQLTDLERVNPRAGMRQTLESEIRKLAAGERLVQLSDQIQALLTTDGSIHENVRSLKALSMEVEKLDPETIVLREMVDSIRTCLLDYERKLDSYAAGLEVDAESLEVKREELSNLAKLERKHHLTDSALAELLDETRAELEKLGIGIDSKELEKREAELRKGLERLAADLHRRRKKAAAELEKLIEKELKVVALPGALFRVQFADIPLGPNGVDKVHFLISTNPGEEPKPVDLVASGGELSRITLVLKKAFKERSRVNVLVFDEVDTGVSGSVARAVGELLKSISTDSQVICITHLPQVASLADRHLLVHKEQQDKVRGDRTATVIRALSDDERVEEIARMLAGYKITAAARASARELLASNQ